MKTLIIRPGGIGDCILCFPAMEALRSEYTEVWTTSAIAPLVQFADVVRSIAGSGIDVVGLPGRPVPPRLGVFDRIVSWYGANRPEFIDAVSGLPFEFHQALPPPDCTLHATDFFLSQTDAATGAVARIKIETGLATGTVIHPFSGGTGKNWPLENFRRVAAQLGSVQWLAGPEETLDGAAHFESLLDVAKLIAGAKQYIGNDSGITHLAAAAGAPFIAIFGPTNPRVWAPRGENVQVLVNPTPEEVLRMCYTLSL